MEQEPKALVVISKEHHNRLKKYCKDNNHFMKGVVETLIDELC